MKSVLVVGCGFAGSVVARCLADETETLVTVIDRRSHIGGNAHDYEIGNGRFVHSYGPHIFHTNSTAVFDFLSRFTGWQPYEHRVEGLVDNRLVPIPFNLTSMERLFDEDRAKAWRGALESQFGTQDRVTITQMLDADRPELKELSSFIYDNVFYHYTKKMWNVAPNTLDRGVLARVPVAISRDPRYFSDKYQVMPDGGYTNLFNAMLDHPRISVQLGTDYRDVAPASTHRLVVWTGPIDEYFGFEHGSLAYRSLRFELSDAPSAPVSREAATTNFPTPASSHPFTRITDFSLLTGRGLPPGGPYCHEFPVAHVPGVNEPYYPVLTEATKRQYTLYAERLRREPNVVMLGRLADFCYYNMDQVVGRALSCFRKQIRPLFM